MKIALLSRYHNNINRGGETFIKELFLQLSKKNEVEILAGKDSDDLSKILAGHYDVVVALNGRMQSLKASLGRIIGKYKLVIAGQSGIGKDDIWNIAIVKPDVYVALTDLMANWAKKWAWGTKVVKISNGVDIDKFNPQGDLINLDLKHPIILSVGALTWYKHHERTIQALEYVPEASLLIVGKGDKEEELKTLAQEKLGNKYKIISASYEDLPRIYRSADLFVLPSWEREAFGIVYIEAMASNLPVVAPNDLARKEIVGDAGLLVDTTNPKEYAKAIQKALEIKWGDRPQKQAERFSWDKVGQMYQKLLENLI